MIADRYDANATRIASSLIQACNLTLVPPPSTPTNSASVDAATGLDMAGCEWREMRRREWLCRKDKAWPPSTKERTATKCTDAHRER